MFKCSSNSVLRSLSLIVLTGSFVTGCSSGNLKARQEQRERVVQSSKLYCEFVNGDNNQDIDVALNLAMGAKCDFEKNFSMTNYRTPSEINGVLFCCSVRQPKSESSEKLDTPAKLEAPAARHQHQEMKPAAKPALEEVEAKSAVAPKPAPAKKAVAPAAMPAPTSAPVSASAAAPSGETARPAADVPKIEFVESTPKSGQ